MSIEHFWVWLFTCLAFKAVSLLVPLATPLNSEIDCAMLEIFFAHAFSASTFSGVIALL